MSDSLWGGRFAKAEEESALNFNASIAYDCRMYAEDIAGSIAHAHMLGACGILSAQDVSDIETGLEDIKKEIENGQFPFSVELEDIHMNIEKALTERIGDAGARLHTARSRNDQVAVDTHMYMRHQITKIADKLCALEEALLAISEKYHDVILPGYTHMQRAQPILFAHHMLAYFAMLERDFSRLQDCYKRTNLSPLGACALAGTTYPTDPTMTAKELGFQGCYGNSLDAVSDRDFLIEFLSAASLCMMHLSRLSEELIIWSTSEFGFIELDDGYSTGSSIMPQKKNPDICELIRGKTGRVYGHLMALLATMKGLPLAYNKDMQEDKEGAFDAIDTLYFSLDIYAGMIATMTVNGEHTRDVLEHDFSNATDMADYLAKKGLPFRQAHGVVGKAVAYCIQQKKVLHDLTPEELAHLSPLLEEDVLDAIHIETCVANRMSYGGTGPDQVARQQKEARNVIQKMKEQILSWQETNR